MSSPRARAETSACTEGVKAPPSSQADRGSSTHLDRRLRSVLRSLLPAGMRSLLRAGLREAPIRARDLPTDLFELLLRSVNRLPPARLRRHVGLTSSRREFLDVGKKAAADILRAYHTVKPGSNDYGEWLDFGCGPGRILIPLRSTGPARIVGVDIDPAPIHWLQRQYGSESFTEASDQPPLPFASSSFDVVVSISVFTHLNEEKQFAWLNELSRILRPEGLLIVSTHGPDLLVTRRDLSAEQLESFHETGYLFAPGGGIFNEDSAFHSFEYLTTRWRDRCHPCLTIPRGLVGYQDLSVWSNRIRGRPGAILGTAARSAVVGALTPEQDLRKERTAG